MSSITTLILSLARIDGMRFVHKTIVLPVVGALVALAAGYAVWDGERQVGASGDWIPAFAGMTWMGAGMT